MLRMAPTPRFIPGSRSWMSSRDPEAQHCSSVGGFKGRKLEDFGAV
ncbi:hypothetical protein BLA3211_07233 [Burkholderia aenigmatica]|uniref:Uncharacterized protein n=1 Tax=Burkholderia aenigmatica TaxID=2015348 RepID=A0A6J5JNL0_9BURK|nr:hypothetical protein BLA3211_07233 [Burkholderia aenigmatica]